MTPNLSSLCASGSSGLIKIEYVYLDDVDLGSLFAIVNQANERIYPVVLTEGEWQTFPAQPIPRWNERAVESENGTVYRHDISFRVRQLSHGAAGVLDKLSRRRLLLRITDRSDTPWVIGSAEEGCKLIYTRSSGGEGRFAGYDIRITGDTSHAAAGYYPIV